ncbi:secreted RxLR effector protein 161-like [Bidens hawaiensis]|uniref:secreted RxLR effector protein 161-like n=1 Tax=Bidens hawaiensis TaxID=980011 RepID=UPI004048FB31
MALVAHFDLELHQMIVKTVFLNGNLDEEVYMKQPEGFKPEAPVIKGDVFGAFQRPKTDVEKEQMRLMPHALAVGSRMYAQVCARPNIAYISGILGCYQTNPGLEHWKAAKNVLRYLQMTKDYKLTYRKSDNLEVAGYSDSDFVKCKDDKKFTLGYIFMLAGGPIL